MRGPWDPWTHSPLVANSFSFIFLRCIGGIPVFFSVPVSLYFFRDFCLRPKYTDIGYGFQIMFIKCWPGHWTSHYIPLHVLQFDIKISNYFFLTVKQTANRKPRIDQKNRLRKRECTSTYMKRKAAGRETYRELKTSRCRDRHKHA